MIDLEITDARGRKLDAHLEIGGSQILLHSRSGAGERARNPDYRKALELIFERLDAEYITPETYLNSAPSRKNSSSIDGIRLIDPEEIFAGPREFASEAIRRSNVGSSSNGAWRRLLMRVPPLPDYALRSIVDGTVLGRRPGGIPAERLRQIEKRHVDMAIAEVRSGRARHTRFGNSTGWNLYPDDGGAPLAPKLVFGIALAEALKTHTTPNDFASGDLIFNKLRELGFRVLAVSEEPFGTRAAKRRPAPPTQSLLATDEERGWLEGNPRVAAHIVRERSGKLPAEFKAAFRVERGKLFCERCSRDYIDVYADESIAEACFEVHHTIPVSQMRTGHRTTFDQLQLLCANCHRATHREMARGVGSEQG